MGGGSARHSHAEAAHEKAIAGLNDKFGDMVREGQIVQSRALAQEKNEPEIWNCLASSSSRTAAISDVSGS